MTTVKQPEVSLSTSYPQHDEEIDLRELFKTLWQGKLTIITCTMMFAIAAVVYALNAQQWWTAKAVITKPKVADVVTFSQVVKRYQPAFDIYQPNGQVLSGIELDSLTGQDEIFERFIEAFNANNNKREFLVQSQVFTEALRVVNVNVEDSRVYRLALNEWLGKLKAAANDKNNPQFITLSAESITDQNSFELLNDYITYINEKVTEDLMEDFRSMLQIKNNELSQQLESRKQLVAQQLKLEIAKAEKALRIANAAQIRKPVENLNKEEIFAIDLGADAIREKVNVLKSLDDLSILDLNIGKISNKLNVLQRELPQIENLTVFSYLEAPELPLNRDKPKRGLIVVLGTLVGFLLGLVIVLARFALRNEK